MTNRQRFRAVMNFEPFDRLPLIEWATWWWATLDRWRLEGLPAELTDNAAIMRHLGLDVHLQDWLWVRTLECPRPASHGAPIVADEADYERIRPHLFPKGIDTARWENWAAQQATGEVLLWF